MAGVVFLLARRLGAPGLEPLLHPVDLVALGELDPPGEEREVGAARPLRDERRECERGKFGQPDQRRTDAARREGTALN